MSARATQRGLLKLMLKLPSIRGVFQTTSARNDMLSSLCAAYDEARSMLDSLRNTAPLNSANIMEYNMLCSDLESEIIAFCLISQQSGK